MRKNKERSNKTQNIKRGKHRKAPKSILSDAQNKKDTNNIQNEIKKNNGGTTHE